jgi:hypothetical protein
MSGRAPHADKRKVRASQRGLSSFLVSFRGASKKRTRKSGDSGFDAIRARCALTGDIAPQ